MIDKEENEKAVSINWQMARVLKKNYKQRATSRSEVKRIEAKARLSVYRSIEDYKSTNDLHEEDDTSAKSNRSITTLAEAKLVRS